MAECSHSNRSIIEVVGGHVVHKWTEGDYDYTNELIEAQEIIVQCPECTYVHSYSRGDEIPDDLLEELARARSFSQGFPQ